MVSKMKATTDYHVVDIRMQQVLSSSGAWQAVLDCYMPTRLAARQKVTEDFEVVRMMERDDSRLFHGGVDKAANQLAMLGLSKPTCCQAVISIQNSKQVRILKIVSTRI